MGQLLKQIWGQIMVFEAFEIKAVGYFIMLCAGVLIFWGEVIEVSVPVFCVGVFVLCFGFAAVRYGRDLDRREYGDLWGESEDQRGRKDSRN